MHNVLVLDDDPDIGLMVQMILEFGGYGVSVVENAAEAGKILRNNKVDLVIMDMLLSGVNGIDICAAFKSDPAIAHIPVMMMSAHPDAQRICLQAGADDFIAKPFEMKDILTKSSSLLKEHAGA